MSDHPPPEPPDGPPPRRPSWERLPPDTPQPDAPTASWPESAAPAAGPESAAPAAGPDWSPPPPPAFGRPGTDPPPEPPPPAGQPSGWGQPGGGQGAGWAQPAAGQPAGWRQPDGDQPAGWAQPGGDQPAAWAQPGGDQPAAWAQPGGDQPAAWGQPGGDQPAGWAQPGGGQPAGWAQGGGGGWSPQGELAWGEAVGPPPPPAPGPGRPALLRTPVLLTVALVTLLAIVGLTWWLSTTFTREVGDLGDLEEFLDEQAALGSATSEVRGAVDGTSADGDFTMTDVEIREDSFGDFEIRGTVAYDGDEPVRADLTAEVNGGGESLAQATTDAGVPFAPGDTRRVAFLTSDDYTDAADEVALVVDDLTETPVDVVEGTQTVEDLTFTDIRVVEDSVGDFQVDATVTWSGDAAVQDAALLATLRDDGETVAELSTAQTLDPGESLSVSFISFETYGDFDEVVFDADISRD